MFTEIEIIISALLGFGFGIATMIAAIFVKQSKFEKPSVMHLETNNLKKRTAPFIEIHKSYMVDSSEVPSKDSINRFKEKIESFKFRNRFYKS